MSTPLSSARGVGGRERVSCAVRNFFDLIGPEQCAGIETVTIDMADLRTRAGPSRNACPTATIIYDRFHVQQLSTNAVAEVRRDQQRALRDTGNLPSEATVTKGTRFALRP